MGGFGSGLKPGQQRKQCITDTLVIDGFKVLGKVLHPRYRDGVIRHIRSENLLNSVSYSLNADYIQFVWPVQGEETKYTIPLAVTTQPHGGVRFWFKCLCGRRVAKLHLPVDSKQVACRQCHNLAYESTQQNHKLDWVLNLVAKKRKTTMKKARAIFRANPGYVSALVWDHGFDKNGCVSWA